MENPVWFTYVANSNIAVCLKSDTDLWVWPIDPQKIVSWSLTSLFNTIVAISETKGQVEIHPYPVKEGQQYINLNPGRLFV